MVNFSLWKDAFLKPKETFQKEKANASLKEGVMNILAASVIISVLFSIVVLIFGASLIPQLGFLAGAGVVLIILAIFIFFVVIELIGTFINVGIIWIVAKLLGGTGSYDQQYYLTSLFTAPLLVLLVLMVIPLIGWLVMFVVSIYSLYLLYLVIKQVHGLSTGRAILSIFLIPIIALVLLFIVIGVVVMKQL